MFDNYISKYESLWKMFIRPPKAEYSICDLGLSNILIKETLVNRTDFQIQNQNQNLLQCSLFEIQDQNCKFSDNNHKAQNENTIKPLLIYLHCNTGSRLEALPLLNELAPIGVNLCSFDFSGCGKSEGEYITLGVNEVYDVKCVIDFLRLHKKADQIVLWGRSMGAVTGLLYASKFGNISGIISDSAFASLHRMAMDIGNDKTSLPSLVLKGIIHLINNTIKDKASFNMKQLELEDKMKTCRMPCLFAASKGDTLVPYQHTESLFNHYGGCKQLVFFTGNHSETRPINYIQSCISFIRQQFNISEQPIFQPKFFQNTQQLYNNNNNLHQRATTNTTTASLVESTPKSEQQTMRQSIYLQEGIEQVMHQLQEMDETEQHKVMEEYQKDKNSHSHHQHQFQQQLPNTNNANKAIRKLSSVIDKGKQTQQQQTSSSFSSLHNVNMTPPQKQAVQEQQTFMTFQQSYINYNSTKRNQNNQYQQSSFINSGQQLNTSLPQQQQSQIDDIVNIKEDSNPITRLKNKRKPGQSNVFITLKQIEDLQQSTNYSNHNNNSNGYINNNIPITQLSLISSQGQEQHKQHDQQHNQHNQQQNQQNQLNYNNQNKQHNQYINASYQPQPQSQIDKRVPWQSINLVGSQHSTDSLMHRRIGSKRKTSSSLDSNENQQYQDNHSFKQQQQQQLIQVNQEDCNNSKHKPSNLNIFPQSKVKANQPSFQNTSVAQMMERLNATNVSSNSNQSFFNKAKFAFKNQTNQNDVIMQSQNVVHSASVLLQSTAVPQSIQQQLKQINNQNFNKQSNLNNQNNYYPQIIKSDSPEMSRNINQRKFQSFNVPDTNRPQSLQTQQKALINQVSQSISHREAMLPTNSMVLIAQSQQDLKSKMSKMNSHYQFLNNQQQQNQNQQQKMNIQNNKPTKTFSKIKPKNAQSYHMPTMQINQQEENVYDMDEEKTLYQSLQTQWQRKGKHLIEQKPLY